MRVNGTARSDEIPDVVSDDEPLNRRIHSYQVKDDGSASSAAFTDDEMSSDRADWRSAVDSLAEHPLMGLAQYITSAARAEAQKVIARKELLNPAHAEVHGKKTRAVAKRLARASRVVVHPPPTDAPRPTAEAHSPDAPE